jgi:hypothetical protein
MKYTYKYKPEIYNEIEKFISNEDSDKSFLIETQFSPVPQFIIHTDMSLDELTKFLNENRLDESEEEQLAWEYDEEVYYEANGAFPENLINVTEEEVEMWQEGENEEEFEPEGSWLDIIGIWQLEEVKD